MAQNGVLTGLTDLRRGLVLDINPEITGAASRAMGPTASFEEDLHDPIGLNVRWGMSSNLTLNGTINPTSARSKQTLHKLSSTRVVKCFSPNADPSFWTGSRCSHRPPI